MQTISIKKQIYIENLHFKNTSPPEYSYAPASYSVVVASATNIMLLQAIFIKKQIYMALRPKIPVVSKNTSPTEYDHALIVFFLFLCHLVVSVTFAADINFTADILRGVSFFELFSPHWLAKVLREREYRGGQV